MGFKGLLACLLLVGAVRAEINVQEALEVSEAASASNLVSLASEQISQQPACLCPVGETLVSPRHSSFLPPYCTTILRSDAVRCKIDWAGVCISDDIEQRSACEFPEVLDMSCAGYGFDSQLIFHEGQFRCLLTGKTLKQCGDVCPPGYSPRCIQFRCLKACRAEPVEIIVEVPVTVTRASSKQPPLPPLLLPVPLPPPLLLLPPLALLRLPLPVPLSLILPLQQLQLPVPLSRIPLLPRILSLLLPPLTLPPLPLPVSLSPIPPLPLPLLVVSLVLSLVLSLAPLSVATGLPPPPYKRRLDAK